MNTAGCFAPCANVLCSQYGCQKMMKQSGYPGADTYTFYTQLPRGCICPPGANKECENEYCPRKSVLSLSGNKEVK